MHKASKTTVVYGLAAALVCSGFLGVPGAIAAQQDAYDSGAIVFKDSSGTFEAQAVKKAMQAKSTASSKKKVAMSATCKGGKLTITIKNKSNHEMTFGYAESIYRRSGGKWSKVKALPGIAYESIAIIVKPGKSRSTKENLFSTYGKLESGTYKIKKEVTLKDKDIAVSAKFKIR